MKKKKRLLALLLAALLTLSFFAACATEGGEEIRTTGTGGTENTASSATNTDGGISGGEDIFGDGTGRDEPPLPTVTVTVSGKTPADPPDGITEESAYAALGDLSRLGLLRKADYGFRTRLSEMPTQEEAFAAAAKLFATTPEDLQTQLPALAPKKTAADGTRVVDGMVRAHLVNSSAAVACGMYERAYTGYTASNPSDPDDEPLVVPAGAACVMPEDFGAVGDGKADDGAAIEAMFAYVMAHTGKNILVRFGKGKTYAARSYTDSQYLIRLTDVSHVWVDGQGALIRLTYPVLPMWIESVKDVHVSGLFFEYDPSPFAEGRITEINTGKKYVTFTTAADMRLAVGEKWETKDPVFFALPDLEYVRGFINIRKYERIDQTTYRAYSNDLSVASCSKDWVFPVPGAAHLGSTSEAASYHIYYSEDVTLSNLRIYSNLYFTFSVAGNTGTIRFVNVDLKPREDAPVQLVTS